MTTQRNKVFAVTVISAVAQELGLTTQFTEMDFKQIFPSVHAGTVDVGMAAMTDTKQRQQVADLVNYY